MNKIGLEYPKRKQWRGNAKGKGEQRKQNLTKRKLNYEVLEVL